LQWLVESQLYHVSPTDPLALASAIGVVCFAAAAAVLIPSRRALKVDPITALRDE
jgi:ABC-type antimicrobial peptide transport system permease subunit